MRVLTLDEWSESTTYHKMLTNNLKTNIDVYFEGAFELDYPEGNKEELQEMKDGLLRTNLIMIRQFEEQIKG